MAGLTHRLSHSQHHRPHDRELSPSYLFPPLALALCYDAKDLAALELGHYPPTMLAIGAAMAGIGGFVLWRQLAQLPNDGNA
jgi:hypothetical protein